MKGAALYKGIYLMPGSHAFHLWNTKQWKALDQHMKELAEKDKKLKGLQ